MSRGRSRSIRRKIGRWPRIDGPMKHGTEECSIYIDMEIFIDTRPTCERGKTLEKRVERSSRKSRFRDGPINLRQLRDESERKGETRKSDLPVSELRYSAV